MRTRDEKDSPAKSPATLVNQNEPTDQRGVTPLLPYESATHRRGNMGLVSAILGVLNCAVVALAWPSPRSRYPEISVWDIAVPVVGVLSCPIGLTFGLIAVRDRERASRAGVVLNILPYVAMGAATLAR